MTYIKKRDYLDSESLPMWKLYDDQNPVRIYMSWKEIMENIIEQGTLPTVLVYEKMNNQNKENSAFDILSASEIS
jgi:uncharacterized protein with ParB-like and HNH nuclease domain